MGWLPGMMALLTQRFFSWFRSNRNPVVLSYGIATALLVVNNVVAPILMGLTVLGNLPQHTGEIVRHLSESIPFIVPGSVTDLLNSVYDISLIVSFTVTWGATVLLLRHYSQKLGKIKYWIIVSIPLVYFLGQFISLFFNLFTPLLQSNAIFYGVLLTLTFTFSKPAGGILFGVAFWIVARSIRHDSAVRDYMIIAALGLVLLFTSNQVKVLLTGPYPPFGLVTISFMGLSAYMILVGIYSSAISVSEDSILRQSIRTIAIKESSLLDSIGMAQMEQQIQRKVVEFTKRNQDRMAEETGIQSAMTEDDMKQYLEQVIREVKIQKASTNHDNKTNRHSE